MELIVIINNRMNEYEAYQHTGVMNSIKRRSIELELTPEQKKKLETKHGEEIESISIKITE